MSDGPESWEEEVALSWFDTERLKNVELRERIAILEAENSRLNYRVSDLEVAGRWRDAMEECGVDSWEGYEEALRIFKGGTDE